jgi:hypothetical protein
MAPVETLVVALHYFAMVIVLRRKTPLFLRLA